MASTLDSVPDKGDFDPYHQNIIITLPDGKTQFAADINGIFALQNVTAQQAVIFGVQIGISLLLMTILALMTKAEKRRSIVFLLNLTALLLLLIRGIVQCVQLTGPLYNYYNWVANYYPNPASMRSQSIGAEVLSFLIIAVIEFSLMFQVRIVCCTLNRWLRLLVDFISDACVFVALAVRFASMVINIEFNIINVEHSTNAQLGWVSRMASASTISLMVSIIIFSLIFCLKLAHAIRQRRKMGMKRFGAMQIIFVMGCQTLLVPVIFGIISYWALPGSQVYTMVPTVVATFLPLSSIWASTNTNGNVNIDAPHQWHDRRRPSGVRGQSTHGYSSEKGLLPTTVNTDCTLVDDRSQSVSESSPSKPGLSASRERDSIDLEMQKMGRIRVDRAYSVRSD